MNGKPKCGISTQWYGLPYLKTKEILPYSSTWMNLEDTVLNQISHHKRAKLLHSQKQKVKWWPPEAGGRESKKLLIHRYKCSVIQMTI
jgi:hypothetical protein